MLSYSRGGIYWGTVTPQISGFPPHGICLGEISSGHCPEKVFSLLKEILYRCISGRFALIWGKPWQSGFRLNSDPDSRLNSDPDSNSQPQFLDFF